jgi:hypothetical protein
VGSPQFVPPGRCLVLLTEAADAVWVTSWPFARYVKHTWAGAMVNSLFRREDGPLASDLITAATAATRAHWPDIPPLGMVSFVDAAKVRRKRDPGRCYRRAGWTHVGFTAAGLWVYQIKPEDFPAPVAAGPKVLPTAPNDNAVAAPTAPQAHTQTSPAPLPPMNKLAPLRTAA